MTLPEFWKSGVGFTLPRVGLKPDAPLNPVPFIGLLLLLLAAAMLLEAIRILLTLRTPPPAGHLEPIASPAAVGAAAS
jgi:hypothetical protein